jgi:hypothetical protein
MKIHQVSDGNGGPDKNRFCGPSAISILTGMTTGEAARLLRSISGRRQIKGTGDGLMYKGLAKCGLRMAHLPIRLRPMTLAQWLKRTVAERTPGRVFLVSAGNHWQVITGRRYACGRIREIVSIRDKRVKRRCRVEDVYEIIPLNGKVVIPTEAKKKVSYTDRWTQKAYAKFRKFVRDNDLKYRIYDECGCKYIEVEPTPFWPQGLDTMHYDFDSTLARLEHCFENPSDVEDGSYSE